MSSISQLPLIDSNDIESAQIGLSNLIQASAAFREGKLPTTEQFQRLVQSLLKSDILQPDLGSHFAGRIGGGKWSRQGRDVVVKAREVLEAILRLGLEKNDDDKIQRFIYATTQASVDLNGHLETPDIPLPSSRELAEAKDSLQQLLTVLLTSTELRGLLTDGINLFRDLFADTADVVARAAISTTRASKKAAQKARPTEEDRKEGKTGLEGITQVDPKDLKKKVMRGVEDAKDDAARSLSNKRRQVMHYIEEELPTDAKDATIERFKAIVNEIQSDPQYDEAIHTLLNLIKKYASLSVEAVQTAASQSTAEIDVNQSAETATSLLRSIIESFTGDLTPLLSSIDRVVKDLESDPRIKSIINDASSFLDRSINDPGYVTSARAQRRAEKLLDRAQELISGNAAWKADVDTLVNEANKAFDTASRDRALITLGDKVERFGDAMTRFGKTGFSLVDGGGIWNDVTQVLIPRTISALKEIPLPRIEYTSADFDIAIDGVRFTSSSFLPDITRFHNQVDLKVERGYAAFASTFSSSTAITISGLRLRAEDISYYLNKKTGWIGIEDAGLLDIIIGTEGGDDGLDVTIVVDNAKDSDRESFFVLKSVEVVVSGFNIRIHHSQHPIRNFLARPALRTYIEAQFVEVLQTQIGEAFKSLDFELYGLQQRAIGAGRAAPDPLAYLRAILTPSSSSSSALGLNVKEYGVTKIGAGGASVLAIGVEEELLPGKLTGLGALGKDVVARKRTIEGLAEEGRAGLDEAIDIANGVGQDLDAEGDRLSDEYAQHKRDEQRRNGWKSHAFDF